MAKKKPTWLKTLGSPATSAYFTTGPPTAMGLPLCFVIQRLQASSYRAVGTIQVRACLGNDMMIIKRLAIIDSTPYAGRQFHIRPWGPGNNSGSV